MAKLHFNFGAMGSGKTIEVIETAYKYNSKGMKGVLAKPAIDTKGNLKVVSRIGMERDVDFVIRKDQSFFDFTDYYDNITCLIIDEAQFLTEKQVLELVILTKKFDIPVICYGLKVDFRGHLFEGSEALLRYADSITELVAICSCGKKARFNARKINGQFVFDGEQVVIGADESYESLCESCFLDRVLIPYAKEFQPLIEKSKQLKK